MKVMSLLGIALVLFSYSCKNMDNKETVKPDYLKLPALFSDHMVLQRDQAIHVWGWATPGSTVEVSIGDNKASAVAAGDSSWSVMLKALPADHNPQQLKIADITLKDILIGDVWICSGQSNMEWPVKVMNNAEEETANANIPEIRLFTVAKNGTYDELMDLIPEHNWQVCSPDNVGDFSATGFFFGRMLNQELDIPIGLIDASWGGAVVEAFMSRGALKAFPEFDNTIKEIHDNQYTNENLERMRNEAISKWGTEVDKLDAGTKEDEKWYMPQYDDSAWENIKLPGSHDGKFVDFDGIAWYRRTIDMPQELAGKELTLDLGVINYEDDTYFNGQLVGNTAGTSNERNYRIPAELVKEGENLICVRLLEKGQHGGFYNQEDRMNIGTADKKIDLRGTWKVAKGIQFNLLPEYPQYAIKVRHAPNMIYNAMIQPLTNLSMKGVIWYQGESNSERAWQYRKLFPAMIEDWREAFKRKDLPFYFVQLANYMPRKDKPVDDDWAELRWAQRYALELENTGMAVIIDIGEADNIHPKNKQDVGKRLALIALNQTYGKDVEYLGPELANMSIEGNVVTLEFENAEGGLVVPEGKELKEFALAGEDKTFYWATAKKEGNKVILTSPRVPNPVAVRYGWQQNPECNLYNQAGLPASPFKTDDWEWITKGNELK